MRFPLQSSVIRAIIQTSMRRSFVHRGINSAKKYDCFSAMIELILADFLCKYKESAAEATLSPMLPFEAIASTFRKAQYSFLTLEISNGVFKRFPIADKYQLVLCTGHRRIKQISIQQNRVIIGNRYDDNGKLVPCDLCTVIAKLCLAGQIPFFRIPRGSRHNLQAPSLFCPTPFLQRPYRR